MRVVILAILAIAAVHAQNDSADWAKRGGELFAAGKFREAMDAYEHVILLSPTNASMHRQLGATLLKLYVPGDSSAENAAIASRSESEFKKAIELGANATEGLIELYSKQGNFRAARELSEHDLEAHPRHKWALYGSAGVVLAEISPELKPAASGPLPASEAKQALVSKYGPAMEEAIKRLRYAIQLDPIYFDAMVRLTELLRARADLRDTADQYQADIGEIQSWSRKIDEAKALRAKQPFERIRVGGGVQLANLIRKPLPACPAGVRVSSKVELSVVIAKDGEVQDISVIGGDPRLVPAVLAAVREWVYRTTTMNGIPVEVITNVEVNMNCGRR
jgi:tetratricopeptide (TPR) repeat protein